MDKYQILTTSHLSLKSDIEHWEAKGYEIVSHAVYPNNNLSVLVRQIDKGSANKPVEDTDFDLIVLSALRYALPRHSYIPATVRDYILRHWPRLQNKHWAILSDIREYIYDSFKWNVVKWNKDPKEIESYMDKMDLEEWVKFYNKLLTLKDTWLDSNFQHLKEPISLK